MTKTRFEDRLLTELRAVVTERALAPVAGKAPARRRRTVRFAVVGGAVAAVGIGVAIPVSGVLDRPAFAVEKQGNWIHVTIDDFDDADGLERRFQELGIAAEVDVAPPGRMCADGRYTEAELQDSKEPLAGISTAPHGDERVDGRVEFGLRADDLRPGRTVVITNKPLRDLVANGDELGPEGDRDIVSYDIAEGPVGPCVLVPR